MATGTATRKIIYLIQVSLDGFIEGPNREIDAWHIDEELHTFINELQSEVDTYIFGRRMYETMSVWDTIGSKPDISEPEREFARIWDSKQKLVFSSTLESVQGNARLATRDISEEIAALKSEPGLNIEIGGAGIAGSAIERGLIDELRFFVQPVILGAGTPVLPPLDNKIRLKLIDTHVFESGVIYLRYQPDRRA